MAPLASPTTRCGMMPCVCSAIFLSVVNGLKDNSETKEKRDAFGWSCLACHCEATVRSTKRSSQAGSPRPLAGARDDGPWTLAQTHPRHHGLHARAGEGGNTDGPAVDLTHAAHIDRTQPPPARPP